MAKEVSERTGPIDVSSDSMRELKEAVSGAAVTFAKELGKALMAKPRQVPWITIIVVTALVGVMSGIGGWQLVELQQHKALPGHATVMALAQANRENINTLRSRMDAQLERINDKLDRIVERLPNGVHN